MNLAEISPVAIVASLGLFALGIGIGLCFLRLMLGPSMADRVVALDLIAILLVGMLVLYAIEGYHQEAIPVAMALALLNFLGTIGYAVYIQRKATP